MKLLVTGREGQLARSLAERGGDRPDLQMIFVARPDVDLETPGSVAGAIARHRPDVVVNAAAYTAVDQAEDESDRARRINADAAGEAAEAARRAGAAIVQISTDYVFDGTARTAYREDDPVRPLGVYGRTKLLGEEQVRAANPRHAILRTSWLFSPFGRNFLRSIMAAAQTRDRLRIVDDQHGSPTSALDLADAILALIEHWGEGREVGHGETYHIAGAGVTSWYGLASAAMTECSRLGLPSAEVQSIGTQDWPTRAVRPVWSVLDSSKLAADVGFAMPNWREAVRDVVPRLAAADAHG